MRRVTTVDVMLFVTVIIWALNFTVTKYVLTHGFRPLAYSSIRYGTAATLFAAFTARREGTLATHRRDLWLVLFAAGSGVWLNQITYVYSIRFTTATTVALILGSTPVFAALFAYVAGLERLAARFWLASAVSFAGVALIAAGSGGGLSGDVKGDLLAIATAASWAAYSVAVAPLMRRYSPYRISAIVLMIGWVPLAASASVQLAHQDFGRLGSLVWLCLAYSILAPLVLTNILWFTAVDRVGPSHATLFANIQPFIAAIFAMVLLSERLTAIQLAGGFAIAAGIVLARRSSITAPVE